MEKKGMGLNNLAPAVMMIVVVGILLGIGIFTLSEVSKGVSQNQFTVVNETVTLTDAGVLLSKSTWCGANSFEIVRVTLNNSLLVQPANYSLNFNTSLMQNLTSSFPSTKMNVTYTYKGDLAASGGSCSAIDTVKTGAGGFASWMSVIVVVLAAAIVLGIVVGSFRRKQHGI